MDSAICICHIIESGTTRSNYANYAAVLGDQLRIFPQSGVVRYHQNNMLLYPSAVAATLPFTCRYQHSHGGDLRAAPTRIAADEINLAFGISILLIRMSWAAGP